MAYVPFITGPESEWDRVLTVARVNLSWRSRILHLGENLRLVEVLFFHFICPA